MFNLIIAIIGLVVLIVFGVRALNDFGFGWQWKLPLPFGEFSKKADEILNPTSESIEMKKLSPVLIKLNYKAPALTSWDSCDNDICEGEYILIGESLDTVRVDSTRCIEFKPESYHYDSGPYNPETGTYTKIITDWQGVEIRKCGWFDIPKSRIISRENILYESSIKKEIPNYDTIDEFGSKIVK